MKTFYLGILLTLSLYAVDESLTHKNISQYVLENYASGMPDSEVKEIEKLLFREKIREYLPKVGISYFGFKNKNENQVDSGFDEYRLTIQQLLYDGGDTSRQKDIVLLATKLEGEDRKQKINRMLLDSKRLYFKCLTNNFKFQLSNKNKEKALKYYRATSKEVQLGLKRNVDRLESELKLTEAEAQLNRAKLVLGECSTEISRLVGKESIRLLFVENILSDFQVFSPAQSLQIETEFESPETKKARLILEKSKVELEVAENHWKPKLFAGGYYGKNSLDSMRSRHPSYGVDFTFVLPLGSSSLQSTGRYGIQEDGNGIQRIPGFGPQYVGTGENSFNSTGVQLFDNLSHSRKILDGEIKTKDARRNLQELLHKNESERNKTTSKVLILYDTYKSNYLKLLLKIELLRQSYISIKMGMISLNEHYNLEFEVYKLLIEFSEVISEYIISIYEYASLSDLEDLELFFKYSKETAHLEIKNFLEESRK
jgi:hypothetical protein